MIKKIGQIMDYDTPGFNLWQKIEAQEQCKIQTITRLGIQMPVNSRIYLNNTPIQMGSLERIEFKDVDIVSPIIVEKATQSNEIENDESKMYIILDYEYIAE